MSQLRRVLVCSFFVLFFVEFSRIGIPESPVSSDSILKMPITIAASCTGRFATGHSWYLSVNSKGHSSLFVETALNKDMVDFVITDAQLFELRQLLVRQKFFEITGDSFGYEAPDSSSRLITITVGEQTKSVRMGFVDVSQYDANGSAIKEIACVSRIHLVIRSWIADEHASNLSVYDRKIIATVDKTSAGTQPD